MNHSFIGKDHPPNYKNVGTIDVADPADVKWALERDYKIGTIYNGRSGSVAEPYAADIYEEVLSEEICIACLEPINNGDPFYPDASGGNLHARCCGPERESYTRNDLPLRDGDPIPEPQIWQE